MNKDILSKIEQEQMISREELEELLTTTDQELIEELYRRARATAGEYYGKEKLIPLYVTVDDGVRLERAIARERQQQEPKYTELCRRFLADEADFSPERLAELDVTEAFENQELEACVQAIADRIWQETGK